VHSPFVYDLIVNVLRSRVEYSVLNRPELARARENRAYRQLCRLIDRGDYRHVLLAGRERDRALTSLCLTEFSPRVSIVTPDTTWDFFHLTPLERPVSRGEIDDWLATRAPLHACILVSGIRENPFNRTAWDEIRPRCHVSIDLSHHALLFFDTRLQPGHYAL
jgi:hypothetical protein